MPDAFGSHEIMDFLNFILMHCVDVESVSHQKRCKRVRVEAYKDIRAFLSMFKANQENSLKVPQSKRLNFL